MGSEMYKERARDYGTHNEDKSKEKGMIVVVYDVYIEKNKAFESVWSSKNISSMSKPTEKCGGCSTRR
jgi:hypothetical protein